MRASPGPSTVAHTQRHVEEAEVEADDRLEKKIRAAQEEAAARDAANGARIVELREAKVAAEQKVVDAEEARPEQAKT